jgi:predicted DNA-binding protein (MmcQ/YjbR family)
LALAQDGVSPSGYGLGDSGWVNVRFDQATLPYDMLCDWINESYRAVAPKRVAAKLG